MDKDSDKIIGLTCTFHIRKVLCLSWILNQFYTNYKKLFIITINKYLLKFNKSIFNKIKVHIYKDKIVFIFAINDN